MIKKIVLKKKILTAPEKRTKKSNVQKIECDFVTPVLTIWKTTIVTPYVYKNGQSRFGIVAVLDKKSDNDIEFMKSLEELAIEHGVKSLGTEGKDGRIYIKFAGKDKPELFMRNGNEDCQIEIEDEFPAGIKGSITYDVNLYFNTKEDGWLFNLLPKRFVFHPDKKSTKLLDVLDGEEKSPSKNPRGRPRTKNDRVCKD